MARKRKKGDNRKRTKSGQLSRAGMRNRPSDRTQAMLERFGNHYSSALGRAYATGLLGTGSEAKARLDAGNKFALRYSKIIGGDAYACPLGDRTGGGDGIPDNDRDRHQEAWLWQVMDRLDAAGLRPWLDQLISKLYVDAGPYWLDNLLAGKRQRGDVLILETAVKALDLVLGFAPGQQDVDEIPLHQMRA